METVAPAGLRLLSACRVAPAPAPEMPMPADTVKTKLSFLDVPWVATPPVQEVFLYENGGGAEYGAMVKRLKESLAASLALYLPLAGKLAYVQESQDVVVDCSDPGVAFFEAEAMAGCSQDLSRLASDDDPPAMELASLVPEHDARALPAPVLVVQATRLNAGALALGVSVHHAVVDGRAFDLFMNAWSSMSCGGAGASPVTNKPLSTPNYSRKAIVHPSSDELTHEVLSKVAPNLPLVNATDDDDYKSQHYRLRHRTFLLDAADIRSLKQHINGLEVMANNNNKTKPVSTFVALSALSWAAFVRAKGLAAGEDTHLVFQVDLRGRLRPPIGAGYIGNCVRGCIASADAGELLGGTGLLRAARAIQAAVREAVKAPLDRIGEWMERLIALPAARLANVGGSPLFRVYQTADFGFGMPHKVVPLAMAGSPETSSVSLNNDDGRGGGRIVLSGGKRDGEVRLSVSLHPVLMDAFKNNVNGILPALENIDSGVPTRSRM